MDKNILEKLISDGSDLTGQAVGGIIGGVVGGPVGAVVGVAGGYIVTKAIEKVGEELYNRKYGKREYVRIGAATIFAISKAQINDKKGIKLRNDDFFKNDGNYRSNAEEILEGVYLKCKSSYEEKKVKYFGYFFANVSYSNELSSSQANYMLNLYEKLTYNQLCLLKVYNPDFGSKMSEKEPLTSLR